MPYYYKITILGFLFFIASCSSKEISHENNELKLNVDVIKLDSWLNLMPGGPGSFHISGELNIENNSQIKIDSLLLEKISVFQDEKLIYNISPVFHPAKKSSAELVPGEKEKFIFYSKAGQKINSQLIPEKSVAIELYFNSGNGKMNFKVDNIKVEKTY